MVVDRWQLIRNDTWEMLVAHFRWLVVAVSWYLIVSTWEVVDDRKVRSCHQRTSPNPLSYPCPTFSTSSSLTHKKNEKQGKKKKCLASHFPSSPSACISFLCPPLCLSVMHPHFLVTTHLFPNNNNKSNPKIGVKAEKDLLNPPRWTAPSFVFQATAAALPVCVVKAKK